MIKLLWFSWLTLAAAALVGQATVVDFYVDPVGKAYYLLADEQLVTDNPTGRNRFNFYDSSLGAPATVDVTNPFAILLFYPDYGTVVVLDRTLSEVSRLDLFAAPGVEQPVALARATDDGMWVFDAWDYHLKLLEPGGRVRRESNDLRLELGLVAAPDFVYVDGGRVLLHFVADGRLAVFTNYARFERWVDLPAAATFGWYAPYLTGTAAAGGWTYRTGEPTVRRRDEYRLAGRVYHLREGRYELGTNGVMQLVPRRATAEGKK